MKIEDILTLAKAGFTADQISRLAAIPQPQPPAPPPAPNPPPPPPDQGFGAPPAALTPPVQANGILGSEQPKQETAEDILASIINPPSKEV